MTVNNTDKKTDIVQIVERGRCSFVWVIKKEEKKILWKQKAF